MNFLFIYFTQLTGDKYDAGNNLLRDIDHTEYTVRKNLQFKMTPK